MLDRIRRRWRLWRKKRAERALCAYWSGYADRQGFDAAWTDDYVKRVLHCIPADLVHRHVHLHNEINILTSRLARRYDPGLALNEAATRAKQIINERVEVEKDLPADPIDPIEAHYERMRRNPPELTDKQKAALAVQAKSLGVTLPTTNDMVLPKTKGL